MGRAGICSGCGRTDAETRFYRGRRYRCADCALSDVKAWQAATPGWGTKEWPEIRRRREALVWALRDHTSKPCKTCSLTLPIERFAKSSVNCRACTSVLGRIARQRNPEEFRERSRKFRAEHPEKMRAATSRWRKNNRERILSHNQKRRARRSNAPSVEFVDRGVVFSRDGGVCHICRRRVSCKGFHLDHLVPLSAGGEHTYANVRIAHPRCNMSRGPGRKPAQLLLVP